MKARVYLRVAKNSGRTRFKVTASTRPNHGPITKNNMNPEPLPTVAFAIDLNIPDELFNEAERVIAEINVPTDRDYIAVQIEEDDG